LPRTRDRSRPARYAGLIEWRNTINFSELQKNWVTTPFTALRSANVEQTDFRARREATVWQRLNRLLLALLFVAIWLGMASLFVPPYKTLLQSRAEIDNLQAQVNEQKRLLARQTREVNLLTTDPAYLETIARDKLDLMKEGEVIFRLEPGSKRK
jgi:cell division protein FtsB